MNFTNTTYFLISIKLMALALSLSGKEFPLKNNYPSYTNDSLNPGNDARNKNDTAWKNKYDKVYEFHEGRAAVLKGKKYGFVNAKGEAITPLKYDVVGEFVEGRAVISKDKLWGFVDTNGVEISMIYQMVHQFSEGRALVERFHTGTGFIDLSGNLVVPLIYHSASDFHEGRAAVSKGDMYYGYINLEGFEVILPLYNQAGDFSNGQAIVEKHGKQIVIDKNGNYIKN